MSEPGGGLGSEPMELRDYLTIIRDRISILVLLPLAAVVVVVALVFAGGRDHRASAVIAAFSLVSGDDAQYSGPNGPRNFVDSFVAVVDSGAVVPAVATATNTPISHLTRGLRASAIGSSGLMRISYTTDSGNHDQAEAVVRTATDEVLKLLFHATVSQQVAEEAQASITRIQGQIDALLGEHQLTLFDVDLDSIRQHMIRLEESSVAAQARGESGAASGFRAVISAKRQALTQFRDILRSYDNLALEETQAQERLARARQDVDRANGKVAASQSGSVVAMQPTRAVSPVDEALRKGGLAMGIAVFLAAAIVVLTELGSSRPQPPRGRARQAPPPRRRPTPSRV